MELQELRHEWEKGYKLEGVICLSTAYSCYVSFLTDKKTGKWTMQRYFTINKEWQVSVDIREADSLQQCLDWLLDNDYIAVK